MSSDPDTLTGQRLGYQAKVATTTLEAPNPPAVAQLFTDHLDTIHSPRPALRGLLNHVRQGDTVVIASMEQIARSIAASTESSTTSSVAVPTSSSPTNRSPSDPPPHPQRPK